VLAHVSRNLAGRLESPEDRAAFELPPLVAALVERGWIGAKAGQGFYKKAPDGQILTLDPSTMEYRPKQSVRLPALDAARSIENVGERIQTLLKGDDKAARFLRATLIPTLEYAERVAPQKLNEAQALLEQAETNLQNRSYRDARRNAVAAHGRAVEALDAVHPDGRS